MSEHEYDLNLRAELVRIDRDRAETHKLIREAEKFRATATQSPWRDWRLAPWVLAISLVAAVVGGLIAKHL